MIASPTDCASETNYSLVEQECSPGNGWLTYGDIRHIQCSDTGGRS